MLWIKQLLSNEYFVWCAMAVIIFALTQVLKLPIKYFTNKIDNQRVRRMVNATILLKVTNYFINNVVVTHTT